MKKNLCEIAGIISLLIINQPVLAISTPIQAGKCPGVVPIIHTEFLVTRNTAPWGGFIAAQKSNYDTKQMWQFTMELKNVMGSLATERDAEILASSLIRYLTPIDVMPRFINNQWTCYFKLNVDEVSGIVSTELPAEIKAVLLSESVN